MTTSEITAYLYGVDYANTMGAGVVNVGPGVMFTPNLLPMQEWHAYRQLGDEQFSYWMQRGAVDALTK